MSLTTIPTATPATSRPTQEAMLAALKEAQRLKQVVVAGAGANTNIAIAGIVTADVLVGVVEIDFTGTAVASRLAQASITSAGNIQVSVATTGKFLVVTYYDVA